MQKKLTITIDEKVYRGLYDLVDQRCISRFIEDLIRPHVSASSLEASYTEMDQYAGWEARIDEVIKLLHIHYRSYIEIKSYADQYRHPHPTDTRGWSQIVVSALTGLKGYARRKGPDLEDGSDVKGANCWDAIDTPRFNGCIKAGTKAATANSLTSLDDMPYLFFVMWDMTECTKHKRCRIWVVSPQRDTEFRNVASRWYNLRAQEKITSNNFQLHPPRNKDHNVFRNSCGSLEYPLLFEACLSTEGEVFYDNSILCSGACTVVSD